MALDLCPTCRCPLSPEQRARVDERNRICGFIAGPFVGSYEPCQQSPGHAGYHTNKPLYVEPLELSEAEIQAELNASC